MKLSISNIGWSTGDETIYEMMQHKGFAGLEIAPTRIIPDSPYDHLEDAMKWAAGLKEVFGFVVPSMQSIWYGRTEHIFGSEEERQLLIDYTKKAIDFAAAIGCGNLVFGCPKNRSIPVGFDHTDNDHSDCDSSSENYDHSDSSHTDCGHPGSSPAVSDTVSRYHEIGISFFKEIGDYAAEKGTVIGMEANPSIYGTNYVNRTWEALELIDKVSSDGFKLNLDIGTMIQNEENIDILRGKAVLINHVHISEPYLAPIERRELHRELKELLEAENYDGFISIEQGKQDDLFTIEKALDYAKEIFG